jgi:hypothetical protein
VSELDAGAPLRIESCGSAGRLELPAAELRLSAPPGAVMRPDHLRLTSTPRGSIAPTPSGRVNGGQGYDDGAPRDVRVAVSQPSWLVLSESYSRGWRAWCRDAQGREHALGRPQPIDGYANAWPIDRSCRRARFTFAPQQWANVSYLISAVGALAMLALLVLFVLLRRRRGRLVGSPAATAWIAPTADRPHRLAARALVPVASGVAGLGYVLGGLVSGVVAGLAAIILVWVGVSSRRLLALAALAFVALPVMYVADPALDYGGSNFGYAHHYLAAHWVALAGIACVAAAAATEAARSLRASRR